MKRIFTLIGIVAIIIGCAANDSQSDVPKEVKQSNEGETEEDEVSTHEPEIDMPFGESFKTVYSQSYVLGYAQPAGLELVQSGGVDDIEWNKERNHFAPTCIRVEYDDRKICTANSEDSALRERYEYLCERNGDTEFNNYITTFGTPSSLIAIDAIWTDITIECDHGWDANHPAGSSLNDLCTFGVNSTLPYIRGGYKGYMPEYVTYELESEFVSHPLDSTAEQSDEDFWCYAPWDTLYFTIHSKPEYNFPSYCFTVTMTDKNTGKTYTTSKTFSLTLLYE